MKMLSIQFSTDYLCDDVCDNDSEDHRYFDFVYYDHVGVMISKIHHIAVLVLLSTEFCQLHLWK